MIDQTLLNLLPPLRRARGDRLYGPDQRHWVDLWKQDGAWLLGHRPEGAAREWKNQVDKGLATWAPSVWPRRLELLVRRLVPGVAAVRVSRNADRVEPMPVWRPWFDESADLGPRFCCVLPTGPGQAVAVVYTEGWTGLVPENDVTSPAEASALVAAAAQVLRFSTEARAVAERAAAAAAFDLLLPGVWERRGVWFRPLVKPGEFAGLFRAHFDGGFLLNPDPQGWGIVPTGLSPGEWQAWKRVLEGWTQGRTAWTT